VSLNTGFVSALIPVQLASPAVSALRLFPRFYA
jgi:hypothetical protein